MKNMLKITSFILLLILFLGIENVHAQYCKGVLMSPPMPQIYGYYEAGPYSLHTDASACKGSNTGVYYSAYNQWEQTGQVFADLYEIDPPGNDDEHVKLYTLSFYPDGFLSQIEVTTYITGNIDSSGDQTCELSLRMKSSGIPGGTTPANIFTFNVCMTT